MRREINVKTGEERADVAWQATPAEPVLPTSLEVNIERELRILFGTTVNVPGAGDIPVFGSLDDARNLQALAFGATLRIGGGDTTTPTTFRDAANQYHQLTPPQLVALWQGAADYVSALYAAAWTIKALDPIPRDYADDSRWPARPAN